jgi:hypothetical protein
LQAATDPEFTNRWPGTPLPQIPTNLEENILQIRMEELQLAVPKI